MVFSSEIFLFGFLPFFFATYFLVPDRVKNFQILLASILFYAWGAPNFIFIVLLSSAFDDFLGLKMKNVRKETGKKILCLSIISNIMVLAYAKYANFFVGEMNQVLNHFAMDPIPWTQIALPLGISFITFQKISYMVDVYRGHASPPKTMLNFLVFVFLFPQLIAGPIVRYHDIHQEIAERKHCLRDVYMGFFRFCIGLSKKILIADCLGEVADTIFALDAGSMTVLYAWTGILCYTFQIYFDFSAYSDMAIGLARSMGFHLLENFNWPYVSKSITEFWQRWHISLSRWMKTYLYIPLGGNRVGPLRGYINLWIVFLVSGLWHGANYTFIAWGAFHGLFLTIDKFILNTREIRKIPSGIRVAVTFFIVMMGWVLFRCESIQDAWQYYGYLFGNAPLIDSGKMWVDVMTNRSVFILCICLLTFFPTSRFFSDGYVKILNNIPVNLRFKLKILAGFSLFILSIGTLSNESFHPFLYFRF